MINATIIFALFVVAVLRSIASTYDVKASKTGKLSDETLTVIGFTLMTLFGVIAVMLMSGKKVISEIKSANGPEMKYLMLSGMILIIPTISYFWFYKKEKSHIINLFTTGFLTITGLLAASLILKEKISTQTWIGAAITLFGLSVINYFHGRV